MLYTRCPRCETTFRISESALQQAGGQVRCGRCANIFDAKDSLTDRLADSDSIETGADASPEPAGAGRDSDDTPPARDANPDTSVRSQADGSPPAGDTNDDDGTAANGGDDPTADADAAGDGTESASEAVRLTAARGVSAEADADAEADAAGEAGSREPELRTARDDESSAVDRDADGDDVASAVETEMSADEIDAVLEDSLTAPEWLAAEVPESPRSRLWSVAAVVGFVALALQIAHHFRSQLAGNALVGPVVERVYTAIGIPVTPDWDVTGYALLDWVAVEAPGENAQRNLIIRTKLRNDANRPQPFPLIQLSLLDRFEKAVGARLFEPAEYMSAAGSAGLMQIGQIVDAELTIVDPGTDAYGFELAVCLRLATGIVCDTDNTFR